VKEIVHVKYGCRECEMGVKRAVMAPRLLPKSFASVSLLVHLIISKYSDHLPLFRIEQQFKRLGFTLPRSTQSDWLMQISEKCQPLIPLMADTIRAGPRIFTDDTILPLANDDPNRDRTIQARLWSYIGGAIDEPNTIVYEFTRTRKREGPVAWLKDYRGYLIADAYPGYDHLFLSGEIKEDACLHPKGIKAHVRCKFFDATLGIKTPTRAHWVIKQIGKLAAIEKIVKTLPMEQRQYYRRRHAKQITQGLYQWIQDNASAVSSGSVLSTALHYMNNNWLALTRYVTQGYLTLTNNIAEQTMRPIAIGRKNYLFVGSERGGEAAAIFYSLIQTCKSYDINAQDYLTFVLENLPSTSNDNIDQLLPSYDADNHLQ
jgi:transposase